MTKKSNPETAKRSRRWESGQAITEFALLAPILLTVMALSFTASQYMNTVIGLESAARAATLAVSADVAGNGGVSLQIKTDDATTAVNREQGLTPCPGTGCFQASTNLLASGCSGLPKCVWVEPTQSRSGRDLEVIHVNASVTSYLAFVPKLVVTAQAGAE